MIARRAVLAGIGALAARPARAAAGDVMAALDAAMAGGGVETLARIDTAALSPARRLDVTTARAGLAIDAALVARPEDYRLHLARTLGGPVDIAIVRRRLDRALNDLHAQAGALFDRIGVHGPTVGARYARLFAETDDRYPDDARGRRAAVADMNRVLTAMPIAIDRLPRFCRDVTVRTLSDADIAAGKQGYRDVPVPGRAGAYVVDLRDIARRPAWSLPAVVAHELLPGHMAQLGIEAADPPHPLRLRYAAAFVEGWATYAETLAFAADDLPRVRLGRLHWLIFRAARARIDIGMHTDGWSHDDARQRLADWQGVPVYFAPFDTDLARIASEPGTRAAEALAWLALADRAPRTRDRRSAWHATLLRHGRTRWENWP